VALLTPLARWLGRLRWLPRALPLIVRADLLVARLSGERFGVLDLAGLPNLRLEVVGRRSGISRSTPLLCAPLPAGWLIAGSNFGRPQMPQWVHNLRAADRAVISFRGRRTAVRPVELTGVERAAAWRSLNEIWPNYAVYESRTRRVIPVFRLVPAGRLEGDAAAAGQG
jgi:deazaflavin-dependent oxidoreductase (nitroreductase family)